MRWRPDSGDTVGATRTIHEFLLFPKTLPEGPPIKENIGPPPGSKGKPDCFIDKPAPLESRWLEKVFIVQKCVSLYRTHRGRGHWNDQYWYTKSVKK